MKIVNFLAAVFFTVVFMVTCTGAQELPAIATDAAAGSDSRTQLLDKLRTASKTSDSPASVIDPVQYAFSAQSGVALEDMSSGTTQLIAPTADNNNSEIAQIGFLFRFDGGYFTSFGVNSNGLVKLGGVTTTSSTLNSIDSIGNSPKIIPYWDDLCVGNSGKVHYKTIGAPGSSKLIIEWKNMKISRDATCDGTGTGTFQMWLWDRSGVIQFVYGPGMNAPAATNGGYSIGIQSGTATNFASVTTATSSVSYTTANNTQFDAITPGTSYLFSPNVPAAVSGLNATGVTQASDPTNSAVHSALVFRASWLATSPKLAS